MGDIDRGQYREKVLAELLGEKICSILSDSPVISGTQQADVIYTLSV